jgi:transcriptional regulator with XRE-family HTH domain
VSTKSSLIRKLKKSKEYRDAFVDSEISVGLPFQIRALREQRSWSQKDLAEATSMLQPRICAMEQAGYGNFTLNTLKKLASAFDVGLVVRFAPFGEIVNWADSFSPDTFCVPSCKDDPVLTQSQPPADIKLVRSEDYRNHLQAEPTVESPLSAWSHGTERRSAPIETSLAVRGNTAEPCGAELAALRKYA